MLSEIRERLEKTPFVPFRIRMADGHEYSVPTIDHVWLSPSGGGVAVEGDHGGIALLPSRLISGILTSYEAPDTKVP